jgi:hypothetical protein
MPIDCLNHNVPVYDPDENGCYEWMSIKAGKPSKFCDDVDFFGLTRLFGDLEVENITVQPPDGQVTLPIDEILCGANEVVVAGGPSYTLNQTFQEMAAYFCRRNRQAVARVGVPGNFELPKDGTPGYEGLTTGLNEFPDNSFLQLVTIGHILQFDNPDIVIINVPDTFNANNIECMAIRAPGFYQLSADWVVERWGNEAARVQGDPNAYAREHARLHVMSSIRAPTLTSLALDPTDVRQLTLDNRVRYEQVNGSDVLTNQYNINWYQTETGSIAIRVTQQDLDLAAAQPGVTIPQVWIYGAYANTPLIGRIVDGSGAVVNTTYIKGIGNAVQATSHQIPPGGDWRNYGGQGTVITLAKIGDANLPV